MHDPEPPKYGDAWLEWRQRKLEREHNTFMGISLAFIIVASVIAGTGFLFLCSLGVLALFTG